MKEQIQWLEQLQQQDARLQEIDHLLLSLPQDLLQAKRALARMEQQLQQERTLIEETERFQQKQQDEQRELAAQIAKSKSKMTQVRNLRESNAVQRELESNRRALETRESELQTLTTTLQTQKERFQEREQTLQRYTEELSHQENSTQTRLNELREQQQVEHQARAHLTQQIQPDWLRTYENVRKRRWPVLVSAHKGTCAGCHMQISPQTYNNLHRTGAIESCAYCHRMLYLPQPPESTS